MAEDRRLRWDVVVLCVLIALFDGFDTASIGFVAPALQAAWGVQPAQLGSLFGAGLAGLMAGALLLGPLGDRIGRRRLALGSVAAFGLFSLATSGAGSLGSLTALRFLTGLGLGAAMPAIVTLSNEFAPQRHRSLLVTILFCGFTFGSACGGLVAGAVIESWGWRSVLLIGGLAPLACLPVLVWGLPESPAFRANRPLPVDTQSKAGRVGLADIVSQRLLVGTLLLWSVFFCSLLIIYLMTNWLPTLFRNSGWSLSQASLLTALFQIGGTVGALGLGWIMDRKGAVPVLASCYGLGAACIAGIGLATGSTLLTAIVVCLAGFCISGGQTGANALAASYYPDSCRATGVSWANGVGRLGSVIGSMAGAALLGAGFTNTTLYVLVGLPALLACLALLAGRRRVNPVSAAVSSAANP